MTLKLLRIVGARPQFMQAKPLRQELEKRGHNEILVHTGQHYDDTMSRKFFVDLDLPEADINLGVGSGNHGEQTARMIEGIEAHLLANKYDAVVVDGDTNSTLAGALAAAKLHVPVVHIEAGMRSYDKKMPEEINRILTDHISNLLFCPSQISCCNLATEGITDGVYVVGDLLAQCFTEFRHKAKALVGNNFKKYGLEEGQYILLTLHRAENVDQMERIEAYLSAISTSPWPVVWPIHPRTEKGLARFKLDCIVREKPFVIIPPVGYLEMLALESASIKILTDSGGVQREAYHWRKPGMILRDSTEWSEIVDTGWASLYLPGQDPMRLWDIPDVSILNQRDLYGSTEVAARIVDIMEDTFL
ncbi:non-hydrolyzing UDP-N-acetylglucosamine 2-epimerase [Pelotomaculum propionicicum]|uniref:non-hydrolyzing UDP-N-acetylglucosamine 2-epimerase n=1 Tax=Pelotomaculum propionicicum TaxID=258475 RepID=UPI003B7ACEF6